MSLVKSLAQAGVQLEISKEKRLRFGPPELVTPEIRRLVVHNKDQILRELAHSANTARSVKRAARCELPQNTALRARQGDYSLLPEWSRPTLQELADLTGDLWTSIALDLRKFKAWNEAVIESRLIERSITPPWYVLNGTCKECGNVPIPQEIDGGDLDFCPWCSHESGSILHRGHVMKLSERSRNKMDTTDK